MNAPFNDYLLLHSSHASVVMERMTAGLTAEGWVLHLETGRLRLFLPADSRLPVAQIGTSGLIIGRFNGPAGGALDHGGRPDPDRLMASGWGRYVAVWSIPEGLGIFRDPSGGLDAVSWRRDGVDLVASTLDRVPRALLPEDVAVDFAALRKIVDDASVCQTEVPLVGLDTVAPGGMIVRVREHLERRQAWRPSEMCRRDADPSPRAMRLIVEEAVSRLIEPHHRFVGEISGGFDSAVVTGTAAHAERAIGLCWLNYYAGEPEADERFFANAVALHCGLKLRVRPKRVRALTEADLAPLASGMRPALQGLDVEYDSDVASTMREDGSTALLTGQGGDAVFFQAGGPALVIDRLRRLGWPGLSRRFLGETARWTRVSAWTLMEIAVRDRLGLKQRSPEGADDGSVRPTSHPWLAELDDIPPAKRGQVRQLVNCQVFWGDCLRRREGELLHPLLSQPVMEHGLAIPADILTEGSIDRALARKAFADRVPSEVLSRRGKGELTTYYGHVVRESLPWFRETLLDGVLVQNGVLDRAETEALLNPDVLIWSGEYNLVFIRVLLELWARRWTDRLSERLIPSG